MNTKSRLKEDKTTVVLNLLNRFVNSWNNKDLQGFGDLFTSDAEFTDVVGQTAIGREAIIKQHIYPFENVMKYATFEIKDSYMRHLSDDLIIVSALWKVSGSVSPKGEKLSDRNGVIQLIMKSEKSTGNTLVKMVHNSDNALPYEKQEKFIK